MSGGTLIALAADEICMDTNAVLGPVDPQLENLPAASILTVLERKDINEIDDRTVILADVATKAINQVRNCLKRILADKYDEKERDELANLLSCGTWTHDHPITCEEAQAMGLPICCNVPEEVYHLMNLFPQPTKRVSAVQYIPEPYRSKRP
jgi:ClpP class serine protease